jgi:hypothetical protein
MSKCPERQRGRTVNPPLHSFVGSSPTLLTNIHIFIGYDEPPLAAIPPGAWAEREEGEIWFMVYPPDDADVIQR